MIKLETITTMAVLLFVGFVFVISFWPFNPVTLNDSPVQVLTKAVYPGEDVILKLNITKYMNIKPVVTYYLVDGFVLELADTSINRPLGEQTIDRAIKIPESASYGPRHIKIELEYKILWRSIFYSWDTEEFVIIGG